MKYLFLLLLFIPTVVFGQGSNTPDCLKWKPGNPNYVPCPPPVPIDGGLGVVAVGGVIYGVRKIRQKK